MTAAVKQEKILAASLEEFAREGYEKASTNRIAAEAGVSKGLLFHYFGSKKELYLLTVRKIVEELQTLSSGFNYEQMDFAEALMEGSRVKATYFSSHPMQYKLLLHAFYNPSAEVRQEILQIYAKLLEKGSQVMEKLTAKIPLRKGVSKKDAQAMLEALTGVAEKKYIPLLMSRNGDYDTALMEQIREGYMKLLDLVYHGIAESEKIEKSDLL